MAFISFEEARQFVRSLGLKSQKGWRAYCKSGRKPFEIPANPARTYKDKWKGFGDWLGTGTIASFNKEFRTFMSSRDFVRRLGLKSSMEWRRYVRSGQKPDEIPSNPNSYYKKDWQGWGDFLGNEFVAFQDRNYSKFVQAKKFVHQLGVKNRNDWQQYVKSGKKPHDIPSDPSKKYQQWMGWGDWLGTATVAPKNMEFLPFAVARKKIQLIGLNSIREWLEYIKQGKKPSKIRSNPDNYYKREWKGWGDWLGTGTVAPRDRSYKTFEDARNHVHSLGLRSQSEWYRYCKSGAKPLDIPVNPYSGYKKEWKGWIDWLGYEEEVWSVKRVKGLLSDLIKSRVIYEWDEAVLYSLLLRKGL